MIKDTSLKNRKLKAGCGCKHVAFKDGLTIIKFLFAVTFQKKTFTDLPMIMYHPSSRRSCRWRKHTRVCPIMKNNLFSGIALFVRQRFGTVVSVSVFPALKYPDHPY